MKKLLFTLFSIVFLFSCSESAKDSSESAKDIDVNKIENPCDLVDEFLIVADKILELREKYEGKDDEDVPDSAWKEMEDLMKKIRELQEKAEELGIEGEDGKDCKNFDEVDEKMKEVKYPTR